MANKAEMCGKMKTNVCILDVVQFYLFIVLQFVPEWSLSSSLCVYHKVYINVEMNMGILQELVLLLSPLWFSIYWNMELAVLM